MGCFKNPIDHLVEFIHKSLRCTKAPFPIPARRSLCLINGSWMQREMLRRHSMAEESLRRASSRETGLTLPDLRSSIRLTISASQAV